MPKHEHKNSTKPCLPSKKARVEAAKQGIENGVALRVLVNGAWGFASVGSLTAKFCWVQFQMLVRWLKPQVNG